MLPPEYRHTESSSGSIIALPQTDIYQLGLLLWRFATNRVFTSRSVFCTVAGCTTKVDTICTKPHADPVQLPSLGEDTPQYLEDIIAACRAENPDKRPPAWKLLEKFPPVAEDKANLSETTGSGDILRPLTQQNDSVDRVTVEGPASQRLSTQPGLCSGHIPKHSQRLEEYLEGYEFTICCNHCRDRTTLRYFHCSICESGDYDICPRCFFHGKHCLEQDHYLLEYSEGNKEERYFTNVKETGQRDVISIEHPRLSDEES